MAARISFRPLAGARDQTPYCFLLEVDDFRILLDCGWDDHFRPDELAHLADVAPTIDAVLLSHADLPHIGALPYAVNKLGLSTNHIYATGPVGKMGQMFMYDTYQSFRSVEEFALWDLDDVDTVFESIRLVRYMQRVELSTPTGTIEISAHPSGRTLGGAVWRIVKETEEIVYAVDFNHRKEKHLNPWCIEDFHRPTLLIADVANALGPHEGRKIRDKDFFTNILETLRHGGNVLIPIDSAARVLEVMLLMDQYWTFNRLRNYSIAFLSNTSFNTVKFAQSQLEWMCDDVTNYFEASRENPFSFSYIQLCHSLEELKSTRGPVVVLATTASLEYGMARELFTQWCDNPSNMVLFTEHGRPNTLAHAVMSRENESITVQMKRRVHLDGEELEEWMQMKHLEREQQRIDDAERLLQEERKELEESEMAMVPDTVTVLQPTINRYFTDASVHDLIVTTSSHHMRPYPMFPSNLPKFDYDEFGEHVQWDEILKHVNESPDGEGEDDVLMMDARDTLDAIEEYDEEPTKCIVEELQLNVRCQLHFVDLEGRSDGRSIKNILSTIEPRKLILTHANDHCIKLMTRYVEKHVKQCERVLSPNITETASIATGTSVYNAMLSDELSRMPLFPAGNYELSFIDAIMRVAEVEAIPSVSASGSSATDSKGKEEETLEPNTTASSSAPVLEAAPLDRIAPHPAIMVGELKLSDFKKLLDDAGYHCAFSKGVLLVEGGISLSKPSHSRRIVVKGPVSPVYYRIRDLLYQQYQII
mmetsp:Transcript_12290/g.37200  ORF Transcript_12290/g.37200 Transcript_12290/m.37200 type:complete len:762 (-) Transcript_12290:32-2317(-)